MLEYVSLICLILLARMIEFNKCEALFMKNKTMCDQLMKDPVFEVDSIVGKPWRIFYTWNVKLEHKCLDITFTAARPSIVQRFWGDMHEYLENQPVWDAATLHATVEPANHEMLLFADQGAAGTFTAIPNTVREANLLPLKKSVPLLKLNLKLVHDGKFLVILDCTIGVGSLSGSLTQPIPQTMMLDIASKLNLGDGYPACVDRRKDDNFPLH